MGTKGYTLPDGSSVTVKQLSDLPTPSAGVITLADNTTYTISGAVNIGTNTITMGSNTTIRGNSYLTNSLTYTGSGTMITSTNKSFRIDDVTIGCANGTVFSISGTGVETVELFRFKCDGIKTLGSVSGLLEFKIALATMIDNNTTGGITFSGTIHHVVIANSMFENNAGTLFDFGTATCDHLQVVSNMFTINNTQTGFAGTPTITISQFTSNTFTGAGTYTTGGTILPTTPGYIFIGNTGINSTVAVGEQSFQANASATTITVAGTYYKAAGTTTSGTANLFSLATTNRLVYTGTLTRTFRISASCAVSCGTNAQTLGIKIAKGGTTVASSEQEIRVSNAGQSSTGVAACVVTLATNEYVEVFVTNKTATNAVTVEYMNFTATNLN